METLDTISDRAFMDEAEALQALLPPLAKYAAHELDILALSRELTEPMLHRRPPRGVEAFLNAYALDTVEGAALMCLAEALLRIPDSRTADALIRDTFEYGDWQRYAQGQAVWGNLSGWGLLLTGKLVNFGQDEAAGIIHILKKLVGKIGEPIIREALKRAMKLIGGQFVLGENIEDALKGSKAYVARGYRFSFDMLGEGARSDAQAEQYATAYLHAVARLAQSVPPGTPLYAAPGISVKLSALHPRYQLAQQERVMKELLPRLKRIVSAAKHAGITVAIDAEEATRLDMELLLFERLFADEEYGSWNGLGFVLQAYQKRAFYVIDWLTELARRHGRIMPLRLVKGAYWDSEIKSAQQQGLSGYPVFTRKENTDVSYFACADKILSANAAFYPQFATHNSRTVANIRVMAQYHGWPAGSYEFQRLHGMGEALHDVLLKDVPSRIYAPVGAHRDLLAYLIRRLLENGANSSFVHLLVDPDSTLEEIIADPVAQAKAQASASNPAILLPVALYGHARKNSRGMDFGNSAQLQRLQQEIVPYAAAPLQPVQEFTVEELDGALACACNAFPVWAATRVEIRAATLERVADSIEMHRAELVALCTREAGRTLVDSVSEVREAADACRYYAAQARELFAMQALAGPVGESNQLLLHPRGVIACISPWNFPLAIFIAQVAAALVTGNCVIAKPAEQTPRMAARAVALLHAAGIPQEAVQLAPGVGEVIGQALVADKRVAGVVFTGGTDTAQRIAATLAQRGAPLIPFIAETGGQNCMVVDSSALLEQAVDDIALSAFGSAGQRCSSLRVLLVQEDIADELLALLSGAMQELTLGDPLDPTTDIGPVIDAKAQQALLTHIADMHASARLVAATPLPSALPSAPFVAPHIFEIQHISQLTREHFGPILHVIRFKSAALSQVADAINGTGYGLTFGVHSRIEEHIRLLTGRVKAGNIYVNRSMIGATIGVQPFGGEGFSGTGPKAGGPHYLQRFVTERVVSVNTAAIGGNIKLLSDS